MQCPSVAAKFLFEGLHFLDVTMAHSPVLRSETVVILGIWVCFTIVYEDLHHVDVPALDGVVKRRGTVNILGVYIGTESNQGTRNLETPILDGLVKWGGAQEIGEVNVDIPSDDKASTISSGLFLRRRREANDRKNPSR